MKRIVSFAIAILAASSVTFAASNNLTVVNSASFAPVTWVANKANGGFSLFNGSQKTMYVQVSVAKGDVAVYTQSASHQMGCGCNGRNFCELNASKTKSVICQVNPNESLSGDYDFAETGEATGTYQVQYAK